MSLYDRTSHVMDALCAAGIPDFIADVLVDVAMAEWSPEAWAQALAAMQRQVQPILDEADRQAA